MSGIDPAKWEAMLLGLKEKFAGKHIPGEATILPVGRPRFLYLVGPPAGGKSSVMKEIHGQLGVTTGDEIIKLWPRRYTNSRGVEKVAAEFRGEYLEDVVTDERRGLSLGVTREGGFGGTDAIGMAAAAEAQSWIETCPFLPNVILGEGQRLTSAKFFVAAARRTELTIGELWAPQHVLDARCKARGSTQRESFRVAAATRSKNAVHAARKAGVRVAQIDTQKVSVEEAARFLLQVSRIS